MSFIFSSIEGDRSQIEDSYAAEHGCNICQTDTKQAFLYGDLEDDEPIYITPPDWWLEPVPEGHVLQP